MTMTTNAPHVVVVVLTWNGLADVTTCLESFACVEYPNYKVLVVDNGSEDTTVAVIRERYPWVTLIENGTNLGYVGGNNVGMRYALQHGAEYVFILNNDTKMTPDVISQLVQIMQSDRRIAIAGAKNLLMADPTQTWAKYGVLNWGPMLSALVGRYAPDTPEDSPKDVDWVIGNGCMMSREALERVGLFDETFFQVHEDIDWSVRAREAGYRVLYVDTAAILHKGAGSALAERPVVFSYGYFLGRNPILFARKHASPRQWVRLLVMMSAGMVLRMLVTTATHAVAAIGGQRRFVMGLIDGFTGRLRPELAIVRTEEANDLASRIAGRLRRWLSA